MAAPARGRIDGDAVVVDGPDQANRLYNKGFVGAPQPGNHLLLRPCEAAWAMLQGRLAVAHGDRPVQLDAVLRLGDGASTEVEVLAYADLRDRGLVVRPEGDHFDVWPRGQHPPSDPEWRLRAFAEGAPMAAGELVALAEAAHFAAVVDEDGIVTHYRVHLAEPEGQRPMQDLPPAHGATLTDRVLVTDPAAQAWREQEAIGTPQGDGLLLSLLEAAALHGRGVLRTDGPLGATAHEAALPVYDDLRARGVVARSGYRFGTHLRGYRGHPDEDHAAWLLHTALPQTTLRWSDISRGVRLAHGVRKAFLVAVAGTPVRYVQIDWHRP